MVNEIWHKNAQDFINALASDKPTPGGGAAGAVCAATGCALLIMSISITLKNPKTSEDTKNILKEYLDKSSALKEKLLAFAKQDAMAYEKVSKAVKLPKTDETRTATLQQALKEAALVPGNCAKDIIKVIEIAREVENKISKAIISDTNCAKELLKAALICCIENIKANQIYIKDIEFNKQLEKDINFIKKFC